MFTPEALLQVTGDITPNYFYVTDTLARILIYYHAIKFIVMLRNPINRAYSHWIMQVEMGRKARAFLPALMHEFRTFRAIRQH